jgi:Putative transposase
LHCAIPGGGLSPDGQWIACRPGFFLPVRVLSRLFRRLFLQALQQAHADGQIHFFGDLAELVHPDAFHNYLDPLTQKEWVVYAKPPFGGPRQVLDYLGRYTHRVAISNQRLVALEEGNVSFRWKDYRHPQRPKVTTLPAEEFIRQFLLHALPSGFQRIRYFGLMANCHRATKLEVCRRLLTAPCADLLPQISSPAEPNPPLAAPAPRKCPRCGVGTLSRLEVWAPSHGPIPLRVDSS